MQAHVPLVSSGIAIQENTPYAVPRRTAGNDRPDSHERIDNRRDRHVFLLVDGTHTIDQIASILGLSTVDVAVSLIRLLDPGYVEMVSQQELHV